MPGTIFETHRRESLRSKLRRYALSFFPAYRRTGARICFISSDWREVHIKLGLNWKTRNYVGTVFGGSIYGALDPIYMVQLITILGSDYVVWDKAAQVKFIRPVNHTVYARFIITDDIIDDIKKKVKAVKRYVFNLTASLQDKDGTVYAEVTKTLYIADRNHHTGQQFV
jgi:acyl-coenzyme A thioesterase PaaI-like protein